MIYKCLDCGHIFEEGEQTEWVEMHGFTHGAGESFSGCPICRGDYEEATECCVCGGAYFEYELKRGLCKECIEEYGKDFDLCYKVASEETVEVKINPVLAFLFDASDIEQILKEYIRDRWSDVNCSEFINNNAEWFGERLAEEVNNNEKN